MKETIQDKIVQANELNQEIDELKKFIRLALNAQKIDNKHSDENELKGINRFVKCEITAKISTGTQSPECSEKITGKIANSLINGGLNYLKELLKNKEKELELIFK